MGINTTTSALLYKHAFMATWLECGLLLLVKQRLARLVPGWVTQGPGGGAVVGWDQVYYDGGSGVSTSTRDTTSCQLR